MPRSISHCTKYVDHCFLHIDTVLGYTTKTFTTQPLPTGIYARSVEAKPPTACSHERHTYVASSGNCGPLGSVRGTTSVERRNIPSTEYSTQDTSCRTRYVSMLFVQQYHNIIPTRTVRLRSPTTHARSNDLSCIPRMMSWRTRSRRFSPVASSTADSSITVLDILVAMIYLLLARLFYVYLVNRLT